MSPDPDPSVIDIGETLYDGDGNAIGTIRGFNEDGVFVTTREGIESLSIEHERAGHEFGEAELTWRCLSCGEVGQLDGDLPDACPGCGGDREGLYYWTED